MVILLLCVRITVDRIFSHGMVPKFITFCQCAQMFSGIVVLLFAHYHKGNYDIDVSENIASSCNVAYQSIYISLFIYLVLDFVPSVRKQ